MKVGGFLGVNEDGSITVVSNEGASVCRLPPIPEGWWRSLPAVAIEIDGTWDE